MSTYSFTNALIGLAREYKKAMRIAEKYDKRAEKNGLSTRYVTRRFMPTFGHDISKMLIEDGYFDKASAGVFGDALEQLLQSSTPARKK